jgi:uncharacterized protein (DUF58 family)
VSINLGPALLKKLATMTLRARYAAEGSIAGLHQSPLKGSSLEFSQHRPYSYGDELKHLDWKVYGRTNKFYVKQFREETNIRGYCLIDRSNSMGYSSGAGRSGQSGLSDLSDKVSKLEYASYLSAAISYLMIKQGDSVGMLTFGGDIDDYIPPRNFKAHLQFILQKLDNLKPAGKTDFKKVFKSAGKQIKKRGLFIIFSDLLEEPQTVIKALKYFPYMKNDVIVFHILDKEEIELSSGGTIEYKDMETGRKILTRPDIIRPDYRRRFKDYLEELETGLRAHTIDYHLVTTDTALDNAISGFMAKRKKLIS